MLTNWIRKNQNLPKKTRFWDTYRETNTGQMTGNKLSTRRPFHLVDFSILTDKSVKIKEGEKKIFRPFQRAEKEVENEAGRDNSCTQRLKRSPESYKRDEGNRRWEKTSRPTKQIRSARILSRVLQTWRDLLSFKFLRVTH